MNDMDKIKSLRDATGLSFNEIKKALDQAQGDQDKAAEILKGLGASMAAKKADRELKAGIVEAYIHSNKKTGALVELLCETDFVARNDEFKTLARDLAMHITAMNPADTTELAGQQFIKDPAMTVQELVNQAVAKLGENIRVGAFSRHAIE